MLKPARKLLETIFHYVPAFFPGAIALAELFVNSLKVNKNSTTSVDIGLHNTRNFLSMIAPFHAREIASALSMSRGYRGVGKVIWTLVQYAVLSIFSLQVASCSISPYNTQAYSQGSLFTVGEYPTSWSPKKHNPRNVLFISSQQSRKFHFVSK